MDEDDNISNADISIDEEDDDESEQQPQQHPEQQQQHPPSQQDNNRRRAGNEDRIDMDELERYPQQFQLANVASSSSSTSSSTTSADSGGAARTEATESGAAGNSPFHDWDTQQSSARSSNSNAGSGLTANTDEMDEGGAGNAGAKPSFFFSTSSFILRSRKEVAALINTECCRGSPTPDLDSIMDTLFNPGTPIDNPDNIEWIRWLIAGGRTPKEFVKIGKYTMCQKEREREKKSARVNKIVKIVRVQFIDKSRYRYLYRYHQG